MKENDVVIRADETGAALLLSYASILGDKTIVQGVRKLMPGHSLVYTKGEFKLINRDNLQNLDRNITHKSKAIDMRFCWLRDRVEQGQFKIHWAPGDENWADHFAKHHSPTHHKRVRPIYQNHPSWSPSS